MGNLSERTPFGQTGPTITGAPRNAEMAQMIRDGASPDQVAARFGISRPTLRDRLSDAGWSPATGQPVRARQARPKAAPALSLDMTWQTQADCIGSDPDLFFPEYGDRGREAKLICRGCPVKRECAEFAVASGERGIWGELTTQQRGRRTAQRATS